MCFFLSQGSGFCKGALALQDPTPFWYHVCCPLSLSLSFLLGCTTSTFSLSFSGAAKPKPVWFGFPLVTLPLGHGPRPRPARLLPHLHPGHHPQLFFFDDVRMVVLFFLGFCRRRFLFVCVCLVGSSLVLLLFFSERHRSV